MESTLDLRDAIINTKLTVVYDNGEQGSQQVHTCDAFHSLSKQVTEFLKENLYTKQVIGVHIGSDLLHPVLLYSVLMADAAFYSIVERPPRDMLRYIITSLGMQVILITGDADNIVEVLEPFAPEVIRIKDSPIKAVQLRRVERKQSDISLAYVITTSGTTGRPKIVKVPQQCIMPNISYFRDRFCIAAEDVIFQASPWTFDPSIVNLLLAMVTGAFMLVVPEPLKLRPRALVDTLVSNKVSFLQVTPSLMHSIPSELLRENLLTASSSVRSLVLGGEQCPSTSTLRAWRGAGNHTGFYNVYGITEVSCWATCYEIQESDLGNDLYDMPLGVCMTDTSLEISDQNGRPAVSGMLYVGGKERVCLIDDEAELITGAMRCTGDLVHRSENGEMIYDGREDDQCKRHGKRLNLLQLQKVVIEQSNITQALALFSSQHQLLLFVVLDDVINHRKTNIIDMMEKPKFIEDDAIKKEIMDKVRDNLQSHYFPDEIFILNTLPMTSHGKVDKEALKDLAVNRNTRIGLSDGENELKQNITDMIKALLGNDVDTSRSFIELGGDSFKLAAFINKIETRFDIELEGSVFESLLNEPLYNILPNLCIDVRNRAKSAARKRRKMTQTSDNRTSSIENGIKTELLETYVKKQRINATDSISRQLMLKENILNEINALQWISIQRMGVNYATSANNEFPSDISHCANAHYTTNTTLTCFPRTANKNNHISRGFSYDLGKCIDASPLICKIKNGNEYKKLAVIGSHDHRLAAIDIRNTNALWDITLGNRIESSACLSACGKFVIVGCYDGNVYVIEALTGHIAWKVATGSQVKSSPCLDPVSGLVFIASHDQYVYALDVQEREIRWRSRIDGGSIYSSPALSTDPHILIVATLKGTLAALNPLSGDVIWSVNLNKPVFSSPTVCRNRVYVGCVDTHLSCFNLLGEQIWSIRTGAPVFSSASVFPSVTLVIQTPNKPIKAAQSEGAVANQCNVQHDVELTIDNDQSKNYVDACPDLGFTEVDKFSKNTNEKATRIIFGSHDHYVYCLSSTGQELWKFVTNSQVFSSPFVGTLDFLYPQTDVKSTTEHLGKTDKQNLGSTNKIKAEICDLEDKASTYKTAYELALSFCKCCHPQKNVVIVCSTEGSLYVLSLKKGCLLGKYSFPGEVFSSPVLYKNHIFVGCRDNNLYCVKLRL